MQIVLPGALPAAREARELSSHLQDAAPTLLRWLEQGRATIIHADPAQAGCTPFEQWQLQERGFEASPGQNLSAGLAPLWCALAPDSSEPVWLAELVHVSPSRDGAALLPAAELNISPEQSVALFESAQALFTDTDFTLHAHSTERWRIGLPAGFTPRCASPSLVSISSVNEWWPQDLASRPWRRLVNELQMLWFEHPVNQQRFKHNNVPINSLWLFGGASTNQLKPAGHVAVHTYDQLLAPCLSHDWSGWLGALEQLEATVFSSLAAGTPPELVLTGSDRIIKVKPAAMARWARWLPGHQQSWRKWWSPQN